jgi:hypothetical protein
MDQVRELLDIIEAQKEKGVTGASVMFAFFKRRVQPIQQHHRLGFEYIGPLILLACAQRNCPMKPHSNESNGCCWTWMPCCMCQRCFPREIRPNQ